MLFTFQVNFGSKPHKYQHQIPDDALRIGREEDSRGNCLSLRPKPPRPNWAQFQNCSGQVMRFFAWLVHDPEHGTPLRHESDRDRRFIVSYFLADDTVAIFEPPMRNSGIIGGKFLERSVVRKPGERNRRIFGDRRAASDDGLCSRVSNREVHGQGVL